MLLDRSLSLALGKAKADVLGQCSAHVDSLAGYDCGAEPYIRRQPKL